jgi:rhodanese-related sulfurtransferase
MITPLQAKTIMEEQSDEIVLDVRTAEEFAEGHIKGAILLPNDEVASKAASVLPDKNQVILVYCRSGRRSALAANELVALGYTRVFDFGGIISWPYETVK